VSISFWRSEDPVFDGEGLVVKGGMFAHQRKLWASTASIKALVGGYGSGKTNLCAKRAIALALFNAPVPVMCVSPNYLQAEGTIILTIQDMLNGRRIRYEYNKSKHNFTIYRNGRAARIWIRSGDKPDSLKGPNLAAALIDEPFIQDEAVFTQMQARVRDPKATHREIVLTGTPEQLNWEYDICAGKKKHMYDIEVIQAPTALNLALPETTRKNMFAGMDKRMRLAYESGEFVNLSKGRIYYAFDRARHVTDIRIRDDETVYVGMDFNVNPMSFIAFVKRNDSLFFFREFTSPNSDTYEAVNEIRNEFGDRCQIIFPDPACTHRGTNAAAGQTDKKIIESAGFEAFCRVAHPTRRDRYNAVNSKFSCGELFIDSSCENLIDSVEQLTHENFTKQEHLTHMVDAFGYPVEYIYPIGRIVESRKVWLQ